MFFFCSWSKWTQVDKMASIPEQLLETLDELEENKLKRFKWHLKQVGSISAGELENTDAIDTVDLMVERYEPEEAVKITLNILKKMKQNQLAEELKNKNKDGLQTPSEGSISGKHATKEDDILQNVITNHKDYMKEKAESVFEGKKENKTHLKKVYTELFITEGDFTDVNHEHEILKIDRAFKTSNCEDTPINCNDIFSLLRQRAEGNIVLTKGIAGIGKTFSVHKFIMDWAEGKGNQDVDCMFLLPFREINLIIDKEISLHEFLQEFYPQLKELKDTKWSESCKLAFIFDGLDESRLPLNFNCKSLHCVNTRSSVDALFTSLIKGKLLPSALIWVTSRPAAANQIPPEYVGLFTEVRGFTDKQKEEYFRNRIKDETQATKIISHIKTSRSLYIMCHIPVFCWISATVLHKILIQNSGEDIPSTLTEMYVHFLLIQMNMKNQKYDEKNERERSKLLGSNKEMLLKLAKVAFEQLRMENIMFYEKDLKACGIDFIDESESTGLITEIFKKDTVLHEMKVYYFIHLSVQEFLAALHVFLCYLNKNMEELDFFLDNSRPEKDLLYVLLRKAIDKAKASERGHFDLFIRFLMGISLESNQKLLTGLLTHTEDSKRSINKTIQYIKQLQNNDKYPDKSINHFFCILELQDRSLYQQIQKYLSSGVINKRREISTSNCSVMVYVLLMSEVVLDEFNPKKFNPTYAGCRRLVPVMRCCKRALFSDCGLTETCCETVASALQLEDCPLSELDLSDNYSIEAGVKLLCAGLKSPHCKLETLKLARCHFGQDSCRELVSALKIVTCHLTELDLSSNDLHDSGLQQLLHGMDHTKRKLKILRKVLTIFGLSWCNLTGKSCEILAMIISSDSLLRELDLSNNDLQDSGVKLISDALNSTNCTLEILGLSGCMVTEVGCCHLASALSSNPSHLKELDLSYNHPGESGVKLLTERLNDPICTLQKLKTDPNGQHIIKSGIRKYACDLTLDPNTAHVELLLSNENRRVTRVTEKQPYPDHPDRFEPCCQVLCQESLTGRCYWEAEWSNSKGVVGVTYKCIPRKNDNLVMVGASHLGNNDVSWKLTCGVVTYVSHNKVNINIKAPCSRSSRAGVYVDSAAGTLSFYSISDTHTLTHLYTFLTSLKEPLYAVFKVESGTLSLCQME
ncbi:NACHT, LRR and PYD domains-containing protein 12-like [Xyrauchen texanus]|uniref:NACHT, LRR and PYD domains-containing protein 12-like n=1 Tax=Xyrauchen texanus TaxID=154827 RepID=UPI0022423618|nr:NACHT, LRR and PYD domains-containing protein 12-like [Xyrauchen texanus]